MDTSECQWRGMFVAAIAEIDSERFSTRLIAADDAVFNRLLALECEGGSDGERLALEDTMQEVRLLRDACCRFRI